MPTGLIALLDDIASIADDVAGMTVLASKKAAGIVTDDLAVTAEGMNGIHRDRELRVVGQVALGSLKNKMFFLIPGAMVLTLFAPGVLPFILIGGGLYLCFEGAEKVLERLHHHAAADLDPAVAAQADPAAYEKSRIEGAIRTDMVLSGEIMVMGLDTMSSLSLTLKAVALPVFGLVMTFAVYGTVALLVKLDDMGAYLAARGKGVGLKALGRGMVTATPGLLRLISLVGTVAMLAVGGHLIAHNLHILGAWLEHAAQSLPLTGFAATLASYALEALAGLALGLFTAAVVATGVPGRAMNGLKSLVKVNKSKK